MKIEDLTFKQLKEMRETMEQFDRELGIATANPKCKKATNDLYQDLIGRYVIIRSRNEGVNAGYLQKADHTGVVITQARRLWRLISKDTNQAWYEGVANSGLHESSKVSSPVEMKIIIEDYSITLCTKEAQQSIESFPSAKTTCED